MQLYLIRHTSPDVSLDVCYGQSDIPLKTSFETEWLSIKKNLPDTTTIIYSSPLTRCLKLAERISAFYDVPLVTDNRLMEMNFGAWELKPWNDIDQAALMTWMNNYLTEKCPQGESYADVLCRVKSFIDDLKISMHEHVLVVTHAGVIKLVHGILQPDSFRPVMEMKVSYGGVYQYTL